jgi:hypothetical protein
MKEHNIKKVVKELVWNSYYQRYWKLIIFYYNDGSQKVIGIEQEYYANVWVDEYSKYLWGKI